MKTAHAATSLVLAIIYGCVSEAPAQQPWLTPPQNVSASIDSAIAPYSSIGGGKFAIAVIDLETGRRWGRNDTIPIGAASLSKIAYLYELYRQADAGVVRLDSLVVVRNRFYSPLYRAEIALTGTGDGDQALHDSIGRQLSLRQLARRMIIHSSDLGAAHILNVVSRDSVQELLGLLGIAEFSIERTFGRGPGDQPALRNVTTAREVALQLEALVQCKMLTEASCAEMLSTLADQRHRDRIPAGVPSGTRVANKTAWPIDGHYDAAIVHPEDRLPYVVVVCVYDTFKGAESKEAVIAISRIIWDAVLSRTE